MPEKKIPYKFKRRTKSEIDSLPIEDGSVIFSTDTEEMFMDNGEERIDYSKRSKENYESIKKLFINNFSKGKVINVSDSAEFPFIDYKAFGETEQQTREGYNLFDTSKASHELINVLKDGTIVVNGTLVKETANLLYVNQDSLRLKDNADYMILPMQDSEECYIYYSVKRKNDESNVEIGQVMNKTGKLIHIDLANNNYHFYVQIKKGDYANKSFRFMIIEGNKVKPYEAYGSSPSVEFPSPIVSKTVKEIKVTGINLLKQPYPRLQNDTTINGVQVHINDDYSISLKGTATEEMYVNLDKVEGKFTTTGNAPFTDNGYSLVCKGCKTALFYYDKANDNVFLNVQNGKTVDETIYPMITLEANKDKPYEPYKEQSVTLSQPITLRGLKDYAGDVTIDGQNYTSDVLMKKDGVWGKLKCIDNAIIRSSKIVNISNSRQNNNDYFGIEYADLYNQLINAKANLLCDRNKFAGVDKEINGEEITYAPRNGCIIFGLKKSYVTSQTLEGVKKYFDENEFNIQYKLKEPIFEPLPLADQQALEKLHTFYPNTIVMTDEPVEQELTYVADPKLFIEGLHKKQEAEIQEIREAIVALGGKS